MDQKNNQSRRDADSLSRKLNKYKRDSKAKLMTLKNKRYYEKPSESKKKRLATAKSRTRTQQRED